MVGDQSLEKNGKGSEGSSRANSQTKRATPAPAAVSGNSEVPEEINGDEAEWQSEDGLPPRKRVRCDLRELEQEEVDMETMQYITEMFHIGHQFASRKGSVPVPWFQTYGTAIEAQSVKSGTIVMCPAAGPDQKEEIGDVWASSTDWCLFRCVGGNEEEISICFLGSLMSMDRGPLEIGNVYDISRKGRIIEAWGLVTRRARELLGQNVRNEQEDQKGEEVELELPKLKQIKLFGVLDLDKVMRPCTLKKEGMERIKIVGGLCRVMSSNRREKFVPDLEFNIGKFMSMCERFSEKELAPDSEFRTLWHMKGLKGIPVVDDLRKLKRFLLGNYHLYDRRSLGLTDFQRCQTEPLSRTPTLIGRDILLQALKNVEKVLVVFWGGQFQGSFKPITDLLTEDTRVLRAYGDSYIGAQVEFTLAKVMYDFFKEERSVGYPAMDMRTPEACAAIFQKYWEDLVRGAKKEGDVISWEPFPHSMFYTSEGLGSKIVHRQTTVVTKLNKEVGKIKVNDREKGSGYASYCKYHLGGELGLKDAKNKKLACGNPRCQYSHEGLKRWKGMRLLGNSKFHGERALLWDRAVKSLCSGQKRK